MDENMLLIALRLGVVIGFGGEDIVFIAWKRVRD
jgi:hypothetical protein